MSARSRPWLAVMLGVILVAGACGDSSSDDASSEGSPSEGSPSDGSSPGGSAGGESPDPASVEQGGSSTVLQEYDAQSFDPAVVINAPSQGSAMLSAVYGALYTIDPETNELQPRIATEFTTEDGITWTMKLREGVTFTDGTPLNAEAVLFNWERAQAEPRASAFPYMDDIESMSAVDETTFEVVLKSPNYEFRWLPTWSGLVWIASPDAIEAAGDTYGQEPVGAGPFTLESRTPGGQTTFVPNEDYWQEGSPKLDELTIRVVTDPQAAYDTLTTGAADAWVSAKDEHAEMAEQAGGFHLLGTQQVGGAGWLMNGTRAPFDDITARKAVYLAADQRTLLDTVANGAGEVPRSFLPESSPYYDPSQQLPQPDPEEAQRLLDEIAAEGEPLSFTIVTPGGDAYTHAVAMQTQLSGFDNIEVEVEQQDGSVYGNNLYEGKFDMAVYGLGGGHPEPVVRSLTSQHSMPIAKHENEAIDAAVAKARETDDEEVRKEAYNELFTAMAEEYRMIFRNRNYAWTVQSDEVTGIATYGQGTPLFDSYGFVG